MGGGTGTGAAPIIAKTARELGILTVGVVTKPFHFEGQRRMRFAEAGIAELLKVVDTLLIIPNQNLFRVANEKTTFADAFALADQVLYSGVACISDLIVKEGLINLDFADVLAVMREKGEAMMGRGEASGEKRVLTAAVAAMSNPLIEDPSIKRASGLIISITGGKDMMLFEVDETVSRIREEADPDANIIVGASFDESLEGIVRVSVVATGIDNLEPARETQPAQTSVTELAGRLRNDSLRNDSLGNDSLRTDSVGNNSLRNESLRNESLGNADQVERRARLPQVSSPPLRPAARASEERPARPISGYVRPAAPQGLDPYRQSPSVRNSIEDDVLDIPAFLRRNAN